MKDISLNNRKYQLRAICLSTEDNPDDFLSYCLDKKLYKTEENFVSRMKNFYTGVNLWQGFSAVIALHENKPIGICLLEHRLVNGEMPTTQAGILKIKSIDKKIWQKKLDWHFIHAGFMSFYIAPEHRRVGLAKALMNEMENAQYQIALKETNTSGIRKNIAQDCLVVTCRGLAASIINSSSLFYSVDCDIHQNNYERNISRKTYNILFEEEPKKSIGKFKYETIKIENEFSRQPQTQTQTQKIKRKTI